MSWVKIQVGAVVGAGALMGALSKEPIKLLVTSNTESEITLTATFHGVEIGSLTRTHESGKWGFHEC